MLKKHRNTHMFHFKQVVRVEPNFMDGIARHLLDAWGCVFKQSNTFKNLGLYYLRITIKINLVT